MGIIDKSSIEQWILPHLSVAKRGFKPRIPLCQIVMAIFYRLKTGCQWRLLRVKHFVEDVDMSWESVYYHFNKWSKDGSWQRVWVELLRSNYKHLDLSCVQLDGSHTVAKRGGEAVGYQGRKASKTTNSLFLSDNTGQMLAMLLHRKDNIPICITFNPRLRKSWSYYRMQELILGGFFLMQILVLILRNLGAYVYKKK